MRRYAIEHQVCWSDCIENKHLCYIARVREIKSYPKTLFGQNFKETHDEGEDLRHR